MLTTQDTPLDLMLRGFGQPEILATTGVDVGYHGRRLRDEAKGIDRHQYKLEHVRQRVDESTVLGAMELYATGASKSETLAHLGLAGENIVKLKVLFADLGHAEAFKDADRRARKGSMKKGMVAKHGVENPFELAQFQEKGAVSREEKYGARYTLAAGSSLEPAAREKARRSRWPDHVVLFDEDSALDLVCRGFQREHVLRTTGRDIGDRGSSVRVELSGLDRFAYKVAHVRERKGIALAKDVLADMAAGRLDRSGVLRDLGLCPDMASHLCGVGKLYAALGLAEEHKAAHAESYRAHSKKAAVTNLERYGSTSPAQNPEVQAKIKATMRKNHGVDNISQSDAVKAKKRETSLRNFGVENPLQSPEVLAKHQRTVQERYGVENISQAEEVKQRKIATSRKNYGVDHTMQDPGVRAKMSATLRENHPDIGGDDTSPAYPFQSPAVLARTRAETLRRHGVANVFEDPEFQKRIRQTIQERYGVDNVSRHPEVQAERTRTIMERYGVENVFQNEDIKAAIREQNLAEYGVEFIAQVEEVKAQGWASKRKNGTFSTSGPEQELLALLRVAFGDDDVLTQHRGDARYPFACDFYVPSRDLFIELNGTWTHGSHWYDENSEADQATVRLWASRDTAFYRSAIQTWTVGDVRKRQAARDAQLNYVTFWDGVHLDDARLWLALGAPDGHDWEREHSWIPDRELDLGESLPRTLDGRRRGATATARAANWREFYHRELALWQGNPRTKQGSLRGQLLANRLRYLGKTPAELTDFEILRGMGIAGLVRSHSVFDNTGMRAVLDKHEPKKVYDPCAGWGERLVTCAAEGIAYEGLDINPAVVAGHDRIVEHYALTQQSTSVGDAAAHDVRAGEHDMVFTCPPYGGVEIYTSSGAENLDPEAFLGWWAEVVRLSVAPSTQVFAYQINQRLKKSMNAVLESTGWALVDQVAVGQGKASHFNRRKDGASTKREFEEVQVFVRG